MVNRFKIFFKILGGFISIVILYLATFGFMLSASIFVSALYIRNFIYKSIGKRRKNG